MAYDGVDFAETLKEAQALGYAESDPTLDINGEDSAHKLSILNSIIFSEIPSFKSIHVRGIENIDLIDHHYSSEFGYNIRLIALSLITDNGVYKEVTPMLVDKDSSLGRVDEANNIIKIIGQESGDVVLEGPVYPSGHPVKHRCQFSFWCDTNRTFRIPQPRKQSSQVVPIRGFR